MLLLSRQADGALGEALLDQGGLGSCQGSWPSCHSGIGFPVSKNGDVAGPPKGIVVMKTRERISWLEEGPKREESGREGSRI